MFGFEIWREKYTYLNYARVTMKFTIGMEYRSNDYTPDILNRRIMHMSTTYEKHI